MLGHCGVCVCGGGGLKSDKRTEEHNRGVGLVALMGDLQLHMKYTNIHDIFFVTFYLNLPDNFSLLKPFS